MPENTAEYWYPIFQDIIDSWMLAPFIPETCETTAPMNLYGCVIKKAEPEAPEFLIESYIQDVIIDN